MTESAQEKSRTAEISADGPHTETANKAVEQLQQLAQRSEGDWITVTCTSVEDTLSNSLKLTFEYHHKDETMTRTFSVPDSLPDSDVKQFLDSIDYSVHNIGLLEGDELWYNPVTDTLSDSPPSSLKRKTDSIRESVSVINNIELMKIVLSLIGAVVAYPLGYIFVMVVAYRDAKDEDVKVIDGFDVFMISLLGMLMLLLWFIVLKSVIGPLLV